MGDFNMKYIDMHCDTIFELQKQGVSLKENDLHIDLKKLKEVDSQKETDLFSSAKWV